MNNTQQNPIEYFRLKSQESTSAKSIGNMSRAIDSLSRFAGGADIQFSDFDADFLGEWSARQFFDGYYAKTVAYNISKIAALYNKAVEDGLAEPNPAFSEVVEKINGAGTKYDGLNHSEAFQLLQSLFRADYSHDRLRQLAKDIVLFGIFNGGMPLNQIASYKKTDYDGHNEHIQAIIDRYSKPKNKYLFPLNQAHSTPNQLSRMLKSLVSMVVPSVSTADISANILVDLWCDLAMTCGESASDIAACIAQTGSANALTFCVKPSEISTEKISRIRENVIEVLTDNPLHWYAMHLRQRVSLNDLTDRLQERKISLDEIFYPMEEIYCKVGKKVTFETRPVISWLIFYKAKATQLNTLFREIGDLAWGYRYLHDVKSPYAVIPNHEVREYQQAIGTLSQGTQMVPDDEISFKNGDYLVVLGGPLNGRHGTFISEKKDKGEPSGRIVYRISLAGGNNVNWEVTWDPRLVKKISQAQFQELDLQLKESIAQA